MKIKYVCRMCGEKFSPTNHSFTYNQSVDIVGHFVRTNITYQDYSKTTRISLTEVHICNNGNVSLSDFVGFENEEGETV